MIIRNHPIDGLKGQQAHSPGQRPGYVGQATYALKGQKPYIEAMLLPLQGVGCASFVTQGAALGYALVGLSGRLPPVGYMRIIISIIKN